MDGPSERDTAEALAALERLVRHEVVSLDEARLTARLLTGNDAYEFNPGPSNGEAHAP